MNYPNIPFLSLLDRNWWSISIRIESKSIATELFMHSFSDETIVLFDSSWIRFGFEQTSFPLCSMHIISRSQLELNRFLFRTKSSFILFIAIGIPVWSEFEAKFNLNSNRKIIFSFFSIAITHRSILFRTETNVGSMKKFSFFFLGWSDRSISSRTESNTYSTEKFFFLVDFNRKHRSIINRTQMDNSPLFILCLSRSLFNFSSNWINVRHDETILFVAFPLSSPLDWFLCSTTIQTESNWNHNENFIHLSRLNQKECSASIRSESLQLARKIFLVSRRSR